MEGCLKAVRCVVFSSIALFFVAATNHCKAGFDIYSANFGGTTISKISPGGVVSTFASGLSVPSGLAIDASGNIYMSTYLSFGGEVLKFTPGGTESVFASGLGSANGLAFDSSGNLYVSVVNGDAIDKITPGGVVSTFASGSSSFDAPQALAFDAQGTLYVANGNGIVETVKPDGTTRPLLYFGDSNGNVDLTGLAFDSSGSLYVSSLHHGNIYKYNFSTNKITTFASGLSSPAFIAFGPDGNLYVPEYFAGTIDRITPGGAVTTYATGLPGPYGLAIPAVAVPEPSTFALLAMGCAGLILGSTRRTRA